MNSYLILAICIPLTILVVWLALLSEESRLLKTIHKKLSFINPATSTRQVLTSPTSNQTVAGNIIVMSGEITGDIGNRLKTRVHHMKKWKN